MLRPVAFLIGLLLLIAVGAAAGYGVLLWHYGRELPAHSQLADYQPPVLTRFHAGDGQLIAEFAHERRLFEPIEAIPKRIANAFLAAEDKNFYSHPGIDVFGIARALIIDLRNIAEDRRLVGASTITQQVVKNFLLSNEVSLDRKIKEAILAFRLEHALSKDRILELYLNEIYLGHGSYGVAAAALNYFNKGLNELTLSEAAFLAALPKAPANYDPDRYPERAVARRNWVLERMRENGFITAEQAAEARNEPLKTQERQDTQIVEAGYFTEEARREVLNLYGADALYGGGLMVHTSLDPRLQHLATKALRDGLIAYDRRHGWRGPLGRIALDGDWRQRLAPFAPPVDVQDWRTAVVLSVKGDKAELGFAQEGAETGTLRARGAAWARKRRLADAVSPGDVILVSAYAAPADESGDKSGSAEWRLEQVPEVNGASVVIDPHTGRVLAMIGGFSLERSEFNRATQALRQPGSAFKPFVYAAALDSGFTPSTIVMDSPLSIDVGGQLGVWRPENYGDTYLGPQTLRQGLEKSRNVMTVRIAQRVGMARIVDYAKRFGIDPKMRRELAMALGAGETTALRLTTAYAMLVNGGKHIQPSLIDRIQDRRGRTVYRRDQRPCPECQAPWQGQEPPALPDPREEVIDPRTAYQVVSLLEGVVQRGTGKAALAVERPIAGKTGTSNDSKDTWFVGFSPDLVAGIFVGFDQPRTLGKRETGGSVAAPIFTDFMKAALAEEPPTPFRMPPGLRFVYVDVNSGRPARAGGPGVILEAFKPDPEPAEAPAFVGVGGGEAAPGMTYPGSAAPPADAQPAAVRLGPGTGGLY